MTNTLLLNIIAQEFIRDYKGSIFELAFAGSPFNDISVQELILQIEGRKKAEKKLPTWFQTLGVLFPPKLNLEQTSSEITAKYKASLISGYSIADITGGFGIDSFYFAERFSRVDYFEKDEILSEIAAHNFKILGKTNVKCSAEDGLQKALHKKFDVIYADPSRRHESKGKVFFLRDCDPNIPENISSLLGNCNLLMLKSSPMLDISIGLSELAAVFELHIVAVDNEVKELLWLLREGFEGKPVIKTINFAKSKSEEFDFEWANPANSEYSLPEEYLYEPNAAILKSGAFDLVSEKFDVKKLHKNTHLYTSDRLLEFPGRRFEILNTIPYSKKEMRAALTFKKANITTRNFPISVEELRKKWKISDGGENYLFFIASIEDEKMMLICKKI